MRISAQGKAHGRDAADHIPMERLELFVARDIAAKANA